MNDFILLDSLLYHFGPSYEGMGFNFIDVLRWLSSIERDPSKELREKFIKELDMISPDLYIVGYSADEPIKAFSWPEIRKKIVDGIVDAKEFIFSSEYEYNGKTFIKTRPTHEKNIFVELGFTVANDDYRFSLETKVLPGDYLEEIKGKIDKIVSDFKKISNAIIYTYESEREEGTIYSAFYVSKINTENVSKSTTMLLSILDSTKKLF